LASSTVAPAQHDRLRNTPVTTLVRQYFAPAARLVGSSKLETALTRRRSESGRPRSPRVARVRRHNEVEAPAPLPDILEPVDELAAIPIRRNTILLAASMACLSGMFQLVAAVSSLTFVKVTGVQGLLGLGPAIFLVTAAFAAYQAGRGMDRFGRIPVLAVGFAVATIGLVVTGLGTRLVVAPVVIGGFVLLGAALGTLTLVRTAGGDMYPPERRAAGIALVLSGAVVGAVLGPVLFDPLLSGRDLSTDSLSIAWLAAVGFPLVGLALVLCVRPDPRRVAELIASRGQPELIETSRAPIGEIIRRPGVAPALLGALASFAVMASVMNLIGYVVVEHNDHAPADVFPIIGAHVLGMYAFVVIVGPFVDHFGRRTPLVGGLVLMGASCAGLALVSDVILTGVLLFGLGLGWSFSFLAASSDLVDRTSPRERGRLLGLSDQLSGIVAATLAITGGLILDRVGVTALALSSAVLVLVPALWLARQRTPSARAPIAVAATERT
jgi:MFS family permease